MVTAKVVAQWRPGCRLPLLRLLFSDTSCLPKASSSVLLHFWFVFFLGFEMAYMTGWKHGHGLDNVHMQGILIWGSRVQRIGA